MATALLYVFDPVNQVWSPWDGTTGGGGGDIIGSRAFLTSNDTPQLVITNESSTPGADQAVIALVNPSNDIFIGMGPGNTFAIAPTADLTVTPFATFSATAIGLNAPITTPLKNNAAALPAFAGVTPTWQMMGDTGPLSIEAYSRYVGAAGGPGIYLGKSRSTTIGAQALVGSGDTFGTINFFGSDGVAFIEAARIQVEADGSPGVNDMPGRMRFFLTVDGTATPAEVLRINNAGVMVLGGVNFQNTKVANGLVTPQSQVHGLTSAKSMIGAFSWGSGTSVATVVLSHSNGAAVGTQGILANGDVIGRLAFCGSDGIQMQEAARVQAVVDGAPGTNDLPGRLEFMTTPDGSTLPVVNLTLANDGRLFGTALHNNAGAVTGTTNQYIASGTYTPTTAGLVNLDAVTPGLTQWIRVGNVVTVGGTLSVDPTAASVATSFRLSLPIASNLASAGNLGGAGVTPSATATNPNMAVRISGDATNDQATFTWVNDTTTSALNLSYSFTYVVL